MFTPIQKILPKAIIRLGLSREATAAFVCEKYRILAPRHIHANALRHTFPKSFRTGTFTIGVENSAWAEQIIRRKANLLKILNEALGKKLIKEVKTRVVAPQDIPEKS